MTHVILMTTTGVTTKAPSEALGQLQTTAELIKLARQIAVTAKTALTGARYSRCIELIGMLADVPRRTRRVAAEADHPTHRVMQPLRVLRRGAHFDSGLTSAATPRAPKLGGKAPKPSPMRSVSTRSKGASPR